MTVGLAVMVFTGLRVGLAVMVFTGLRGRRDLIMADLTGLEAVLAGCWGLGCCFELGGLVGVMLDLTCCCCFCWFGGSRMLWDGDFGPRGMEHHLDLI